MKAATCVASVHALVALACTCDDTQVASHRWRMEELCHSVFEVSVTLQCERPRGPFVPVKRHQRPL